MGVQVSLCWDLIGEELKPLGHCLAVYERCWVMIKTLTWTKLRVQLAMWFGSRGTWKHP